MAKRKKIRCQKNTMHVQSAHRKQIDSQNNADKHKNIYSIFKNIGSLCTYIMLHTVRLRKTILSRRSDAIKLAGERESGCPDERRIGDAKRREERVESKKDLQIFVDDNPE